MLEIKGSSYDIDSLIDALSVSSSCMFDCEYCHGSGDHCEVCIRKHIKIISTEEE